MNWTSGRRAQEALRMFILLTLNHLCIAGVLAGLLVLSTTFTGTFDPYRKILEIWSYLKCPGACLVHAKWHLVLSETSMLRKWSCLQITHNIYLYFWFTGLIHKNIMFYWSSSSFVAVLPVITLLASAWLIMAHVKDQISWTLWHWPDVSMDVSLIAGINSIWF